MLYFVCLSIFMLISSSINASEQSENPTDPTQKFINKKAHESIIHDAYYEAKPFDKELPAVWKYTLECFGYTQEDIQFYTAVRTNRFAERVGNKIILLWPNFFLYLTDEEQAAYIGIQLATLQEGTEFEVGGSHETFYEPRFSTHDEWRYAIMGMGLLALYARPLKNAAYAALPTTKNILFSPGAAIVVGGLGIGGVQQIIKQRADIKRLTNAQYAVIDALGAQGLVSIREKQTHWGYRNSSWLTNKLFYLLGKLSLVYNPETDLERIKEYVAQKAEQ